MALFEIKLDPSVLERGVRALESIRDCLERHFFPAPARLTGKPKQAEDLIEFDDEAEWQREQEDERQKSLGILPRG